MSFTRDPQADRRARRNADQLAQIGSMSLPADADEDVSVTTLDEAQAAIRAQAAVINSLLAAMAANGLGKQ